VVPPWLEILATIYLAIISRSVYIMKASIYYIPIEIQNIYSKTGIYTTILETVASGEVVVKVILQVIFDM
jgi:hypothetical protein